MTTVSSFFTFAKKQIEIELRWISPQRTTAPLVVFLHEGLGSVDMWGDWPDRFCAATGLRGLVFSRYGYGKSTPRPSGEPWPIDYMEQEAREALPALLCSLGIDPAKERPILIGHSDGGTIALLYAAMFTDCVGAVITVAPHVMVEDIALERIAYLRTIYQHGVLREKLQQFHNDADAVFDNWSQLWLAPAFRSWNISSMLRSIRCPVLAVQGAQDQYGTLDQVRTVAAEVAGPVRLEVIDECRHVPHQDQPETLINVAADFINHYLVKSGAVPPIA